MDNKGWWLCTILKCPLWGFIQVKEIYFGMVIYKKFCYKRLFIKKLHAALSLEG